MTLNRVACLVGVLILLLAGGCDAIQMLPLAALGGTSIRMEVHVHEVRDEFIGGVQVESAVFRWTHHSEGKLSRSIGWSAEVDSFDGHMSYWRYYHSAWGPEHDYVHEFEGPLRVDDDSFPLIIRIYDDEALIFYGPGDMSFHDPGISEHICDRDTDIDWAYPPDQVTIEKSFSWWPGAEVAPDAESSYLTVVQSGIVLLRIPVADLHSGTSLTTTVDLEEKYPGAGACGYGGRLQIRLSLTSE